MATENEQHMNEMRAVHAELLSSIAEPTGKVGLPVFGAGLGIKIFMSLLKAAIPQYEGALNDSPFETITAIAIYSGLALGTVAYILENASRNIEKRLPKNMQAQLRWDRIRTKR